MWTQTEFQLSGPRQAETDHIWNFLKQLCIIMQIIPIQDKCIFWDFDYLWLDLKVYVSVTSLTKDIFHVLYCKRAMIYVHKYFKFINMQLCYI